MTHDETKSVWCILAHRKVSPEKWLVMHEGKVQTWTTRQYARDHIRFFGWNPYRYRPVKTVRSYTFDIT